MPTYLTIEGTSQATVREKMSRFLAFAHHVDTLEEARQLIAAYTNQYHDARHVCWAYTIGPDRSLQHSTDNCEPSGTAGKPILGQLNSFNLTNTIVIVVRYFGGIKLGTPGLITAYREAARQALQEATIVELHETATLAITYPYPAMETVMRAIKRPGISIISQDFDNTCTITISIPTDLIPEITNRLLHHATVTQS